MNQNLIARSTTAIQASIDKVWDAFVNPEVIKKYMFNTVVESDWKEGSPIVWKGEWKGKSYEDKGQILEIRPKTRLKYTHFSPLTGQPDVPENYHTITIDITEQQGATQVSLTQDNNANEEEKNHSEKNWTAMLEGLKKLLETS